MRMMLVLAVGAALAGAAPLPGQVTNSATFPQTAEKPSWFAVRPAPAADSRLAVPLKPPIAPAGDYRNPVRSPLSFPALMLIGGAVGCVAGAVIMSSAGDVDGREKATVRFNGCILGGAAGMFLGGVYGWASGAP